MDLVRRYDEYARSKGAKAQSEKFDQQSISASNEIKRRSPSALDAAETILDQMEAIYWQTLWQQPEFVAAIFKDETGKRHLAADKAAFDLLVADGENAMKVEDMVELRTVIRRLWDNQIATASVDGDAARLASVLRS
jgi:molecular chaperone DnaK